MLREKRVYQLNRTKYLENTEFDALQASLLCSVNRNAVMLRLALATGARAQELLNITHADLSDETESVLIRGLKGSSDREIPLTKDLYAGVKSVARQDTRVFNISYSQLVRIWQHYRPCNKKFHCLRHTFAIQLYRKTRDIKLVQVALGHRSINNTMIYADYVFRTEELRRLIIG